MRPWGPLPWLLSKLPGEASQPVLLGALGAEHRCLGVPLVARGAKRVVSLAIHDPPSRFAEACSEKFERHFKHLAGRFRDRLQRLDVSLLAAEDEIASSLEECLENGPTTLWLDISCLPKRFFFLIVKLALGDRRASTIIVTYTQPRLGGYTDSHLAGDLSGVSALPGFIPFLSEQKRLAIAIGFETLGLPQLLGEYGHDKAAELVLLVPFPPGQPYSRRVWQCVQDVHYPGDGNVRRIPALDAFATVRALVADGQDSGVGNTALAPYGPKPVSLGMCLYAIHTEAPVFYTQPLTYHPDYSRGIGPSWGYCLRVAGQDVWQAACGL